MSQISEENLRCKCGAILPPTARKCSICGTDFIPQFSPTVVDEATSEAIEVDQDIPEPNPDAVPHYLKKLDTVFILIIIFLGIIVNFSVFKSNRQKILKKLINECILALKEVKSPYWRLRSEWPPHNAIKTIYIIKGVFYDLEQDFIQKSGIIVKKDSLYLPSNEFSEETYSGIIGMRNLFMAQKLK